MRRVGRAILDYLKKADLLLLALCVISTIFGIVLIYSATESTSTGPWQYVSIQLAAMVIGIFLFIIFSIIDVETIADRWKWLFAFNIIFIGILFFFGTGEQSVGSSSWLRFGPIGGIQPAEVVKITFIILMAKQMHHLREYKDLNSFFSIAQLAIHFGIMFLLILVAAQDLGTALVYLFIFAVMLYAGGVKLRWFALGGAVLACLVPLAWKFFLRDYQKQRILAPYDPSIDPNHVDITWQSYRSKIAIASGKWTGLGLGQGTQTQSGSIPEQHTDFIFTVAGEELGFIGCLVVFLLLALIIIRCIYVGVKARNYLSALVCLGIASMLIFQSLENIGMCLGLTPVIGLTLPFFSYGGSSIITLFAAMGFICGIKMRTVSPWKRSLSGRH